MTIVDVERGGANADLYQVVDGPTGVPYPFGLDSVLEFGADRTDLGGSTWESDNAAEARITQSQFLDPDVVAKTADGPAPVRQFSPFTVYLLNDDSLGGQGQGFHEARGRRRLSIAELRQVELQVSTNLFADASLSAITVAAPGSVTTEERHRQALALVEQELTELTGAGGVIHMSRLSAIQCGDLLMASGGVLRTKLGTPVAAYGRWSEYTAGSEPATLSILGCGPMKAQRTPIEAFRGAPNMATNDASVVLERTYVVGWDVGVVGATLTL